MAGHNPTTWHKWIDEMALVTGKPVTEVVPTDIAEDQVYCLDCEHLTASMMFAQIGGTAASATMVRTFYVKSIDMCDVDTVTNDEFEHAGFVFAWNSDGATTGNVLLKSSATASGTATFAVGAGDTTPAWMGPETFNVKTNDTEDPIELQIQRTAGSGRIYVAGIGIFAIER